MDEKYERDASDYHGDETGLFDENGNKIGEEPGTGGGCSGGSCEVDQSDGDDPPEGDGQNNTRWGSVGLGSKRT